MSDQPVFVSGQGNKGIVYNVGVERVTGSTLLAVGKRINWLYLIIDIGCLAIYENQGNNVWLGADGIPVAGDTTVLNSLVPREGQRYFNIQTNQPLLYKGGAWGGASWAEFQTLSPTVIVVTDDEQFVPQRDYVVFAVDKVLQLPGTESVQNGHHLRVYVAPGSTGNNLYPTAGTPIVIANVGEVTEMELVEGKVYDFIFYVDKWYTFSEDANAYLRVRENLADIEDKEEARDNLEVYSRTQVLALCNRYASGTDGLQFSGSVSEVSVKTLTLVFATASEILAGTSDKPIRPAELLAVIATATDSAIQSSKYNNFTGLQGASSGFNVTTTGSSIDYSGFQAVFNLDPALRTEDIQVVDVPAGSISMPIGSGYQVLQLICTTAGNVQLETYTTYSHSKCLLALVFAYNGTAQSLVVCPFISGSDYYLRGTIPTIVEGVVLGTASGNLETNGFVSFGESQNWVAKVPDLHRRDLPDVAVQPFTYYSGTSVILQVDATVVDGRLLQDGSTAGASSFTVQTVYATPDGHLFITPGYEEYSDIEAAVSSAGSELSDKLAVYSTVLTEICRLVIRGDQFAGSPTLDLTNIDRFRVLKTTQLDAGGSTGQSQTFSLVIGAGNLQYGKMYRFATNATITLPAGGLEGGWVSWITNYGFNPVLTVSNPSLELIYDMSKPSTSATELEADNTRNIQSVQWLDGAWRW